MWDEWQQSALGRPMGQRLPRILDSQVRVEVAHTVHRLTRACLDLTAAPPCRQAFRAQIHFSPEPAATDSSSRPPGVEWLRARAKFVSYTLRHLGAKRLHPHKAVWAGGGAGRSASLSLHAVFVYGLASYIVLLCAGGATGARRGIDVVLWKELVAAGMRFRSSESCETLSAVSYVPERQFGALMSRVGIRSTAGMSH